MKKNILIKALTACLVILCCSICFTACDVLEALTGEKDLSGEYELVSFTAKDGKTYNPGDIYEDETVASDDIHLKIEEFDSGFIGSDGKQLKARKFDFWSYNLSGVGFFSRNGNNLEFDIVNFDYETHATGKVSGDKITVTFSEDYELKTAVLKKA